jgi:hypothetical protein
MTTGPLVNADQHVADTADILIFRFDIGLARAREMAQAIIDEVGPKIEEAVILEAGDLLDGSRSGLHDPGLRMAWGRRRKALVDRSFDIIAARNKEA